MKAIGTVNAVLLARLYAERAAVMNAAVEDIRRDLDETEARFRRLEEQDKGGNAQC